MLRPVSTVESSIRLGVTACHQEMTFCHQQMCRRGRMEPQGVEAQPGSLPVSMHRTWATLSCQHPAQIAAPERLPVPRSALREEEHTQTLRALKNHRAHSLYLPRCQAAPQCSCQEDKQVGNEEMSTKRLESSFPCTEYKPELWVRHQSSNRKTKIPPDEETLPPTPVNSTKPLHSSSLTEKLHELLLQATKHTHWKWTSAIGMAWIQKSRDQACKHGFFIQMNFLFSQTFQHPGRGDPGKRMWAPGRKACFKYSRAERGTAGLYLDDIVLCHFIEELIVQLEDKEASSDGM